MASKRQHSESRRRTQLVALRLLPEERDKLEAAARDQRISLSALIRRSALKVVEGDEGR